MALNPMQELFIQNYVAGKSATQAAIDAGYSKRTAGSQAHDILKRPEIKAEIEKRMEQLKKNAQVRAEQKGVTQERWVEEVAALGFSDITEAFTPNDKGQLTMSLADIKARGLGRLIRKMKVLPNGKIEFELHPKLPALELLAKHYGWIKEQVEHSGSVATPSLAEAQLKQIFQDPAAMAMARDLAKRISKPKDAPGGAEGGK